MTKNLSSLFPPAPEQRLRRPTWPVTGDALLFFPLGSQVSSHPAPWGAWCTQRGGRRTQTQQFRARGDSAEVAGPYLLLRPSPGAKSPSTPNLKKKKKPPSTQSLGLFRQPHALTHYTCKTTRRPPSKTHTPGFQPSTLAQTLAACVPTTHKSTSHSNTHTHSAP